MDVNNTGKLDWRFVRESMEPSNHHNHHKKHMDEHAQTSHSMLHSTISMLAMKTGEPNGFTVTENEFVDALWQKARGNIGISASEKEAMVRHIKLVTKLLLLDRDLKPFSSSLTDRKREDFQNLLRDQDIDTELVSDDDEEDGDDAFDFLKIGPKCAMPCCDLYLSFSRICKTVAYSNRLSILVMICIIGIGVVESLGTYKLEDQAATAWELFLDDLFLYIFTLEMLLKIFSEGARPWAYWMGPDVPNNDDDEELSRESNPEKEKARNRISANEGTWNCFDSFIVFSSMVSKAFREEMAEYDLGFARLARLVRLVRFVKIVRFLPEMRTVLGGLQNGAKSVLSILLIYTAVMIVYACAGVYLIGGYTWQFEKLSSAMLELYLVAMLNWVDILLYSIYGCERYKLHQDGWGEPTRPYWMAEQMDCTKERDNTWIAIVVIYYCSFIIVTGLILMSMFMGAIAVAMSEVTRELEKDSREENEVSGTGVKAMAEVERSRFWICRFFLLQNTVVDFKVAKERVAPSSAHKYEDKLKLIASETGGQVYLGTFTEHEKDAMFDHASTSMLLHTAFDFLEHEESLVLSEEELEVLAQTEAQTEEEQTNKIEEEEHDTMFGEDAELDKAVEGITKGISMGIEGVEREMNSIGAAIGFSDTGSSPMRLAHHGVGAGLSAVATAEKEVHDQTRRVTDKLVRFYAVLSWYCYRVQKLKPRILGA
jgi:voltage-gated sodium channel